ncbi:hypothetical protein [Halomarina rubra]|uniref:Halobacterial output domain-containing protein n=1 Tax=Halomarina rubra TaxID=2071873 RepID=A0ABD6AS21_9EURY|nr:hypothetical protein [Halomarina rubra]
MAIGHTNVRSKSERLSECERMLRTSLYITTSDVDTGAGRFEVHDPVPLTFDADSFRSTVETVARRHDLRVESTDSPFRLVVAA